VRVPLLGGHPPRSTLLARAATSSCWELFTPLFIPAIQSMKETMFCTTSSVLLKNEDNGEGKGWLKMYVGHGMGG